MHKTHRLGGRWYFFKQDKPTTRKGDSFPTKQIFMKKVTAWEILRCLFDSLREHWALWDSEHTHCPLYWITLFTTVFFLEMGHPSSWRTWEGARGRVLNGLYTYTRYKTGLFFRVEMSTDTLQKFWSQKLWNLTTFTAQTWFLNN